MCFDEFCVNGNACFNDIRTLRFFLTMSIIFDENRYMSMVFSIGLDTNVISVGY